MAKQDAPQATPLSSQSYASPLLAAMAALQSARQQKQQQTEWAGGIVQNGQGQYQYTNPQPGQESSFDLKLAFPKGDRLSGLYHTHPAYHDQPSDELFSPGDVTAANQLKVPSFIWVGYDGKTREYIPGQTPTQMQGMDNQLGLQMGARTSKGFVVNPPPQTPVQQVAQQPSGASQALVAALQSAQSQPDDQQTYTAGTRAGSK